MPHSRKIIYAGVIVGLMPAHSALARDNGQYAQSPLKPWFDSLHSAKGYCCSDADGRDTEYDARADGYYVPKDGTWIRVPDEALITEPNRAGRPMVWFDPRGNIRCFIPGAGL